MSEWQSIIGSNRGSSYGTCSRSIKQSTTQYNKHFLNKSDTLQGLALRYNCSTDEIRRINKLYSTDSIFLRDYLLIPGSKQHAATKSTNLDPSRPSNSSNSVSEKELDARSFLKQLDSKIAAGKSAVKDYKPTTEFDSADPTFKASTKFFQSTKYTNSNKSSLFSHSSVDGSNQQFEL